MLSDGGVGLSLEMKEYVFDGREDELRRKSERMRRKNGRRRKLLLRKLKKKQQQRRQQMLEKVPAAEAIEEIPAAEVIEDSINGDNLSNEEKTGDKGSFEQVVIILGIIEEFKSLFKKSTFK
ncbi:hypothetical protein MKW98_026783 [Papaver atlanticum]|uniref:Uncharacterized protein n=1 Tax=Papaver atlanticum TaxID=357466 RepID=A0AAD4S0I3_9MAGN|nr:hypothetical protein MKW98_026783 [Papaver atlanticum]